MKSENICRNEILQQKQPYAPLAPIAQICFAMKKCLKNNTLQQHKTMERLLIHVELMTKVSTGIVEEFVQFVIENK